MIRRADHVLLIGMMGAGKSVVGEGLARRLFRTYVDTDTVVEAEAGRSVADIFATSGEAVFRQAESEALRRAVASSDPAVIALGGGAVLEDANRTLIRGAGLVIWLRATTETLAARLGDGTGRPLLAGGVPAAITRLDVERRPRYEEVADVVIDVDGRDTESVVSDIIHALHERVRVALTDRSYDVIVGPGARYHLAEMLPPSSQRAAIVTQDGIGVHIECPIPVTEIRIEHGEHAKSLQTVEELCRSFARAGLTRNDVVVALGGGVVSDVAGFAAACYHRGTALVNVPTTLLGQIDAAIGGKTGVNIPEGKNLIGAFYQPRGVLCDTDVLVGLPEREWRSGLGEMAKYAFLGVSDLDRIPIVDQVARCVEAKGRVISADERESGERATLNYGHTLAHALEAMGFDEGAFGFDLRHGEAVAIGLIFAAHLAQILGRVDEARVKRHYEVVGHYGLPSALPEGLDADVALSFMARDKKATDGLTFVLDGPKGVESVSNVAPELVRQALGVMDVAASVS